MFGSLTGPRSFVRFFDATIDRSILPPFRDPSTAAPPVRSSHSYDLTFDSSAIPYVADGLGWWPLDRHLTRPFAFPNTGRYSKQSDGLPAQRLNPIHISNHLNADNCRHFSTFELLPLRRQPTARCLRLGDEFRMKKRGELVVWLNGCFQPMLRMNATRAVVFGLECSI